MPYQVITYEKRKKDKILKKAKLINLYLLLFILYESDNSERLRIIILQ